LLPQVTNTLTNGAAKGNTAEQGAPAPQATPPRDLYWRSGSYLAMRSGDWKLQRTENPARSRLFNLAIDPTEQHDLAAAEPVRRANMEAQLQRFNAAQAKPLWPSLLEAPIAIDHSLKQPKLPTGDYVYWSN